MKIKISFFLLFSLALFFTASVHAGGLINKNFGVEYFSTLSRNAATDAADAAQYNPAGVTKLKDGFTGNLSLSYLFKKYENTIYVNDDSSSLLDKVHSVSDEGSYPPSLYMVYKKKKIAGFVAFTVPGGGGKVIYDDGTRTTNTYANLIFGSVNSQAPLPSFGVQAYDHIGAQTLEAYSIYYGATLGVAYEINKMISVSAGGRYVDANKEAQVKLTMVPTTLGTLSGAPTVFDIDYEDTADGFNAFLGINIAPSDKLNIGLRYETRAELDFERKINKDSTGMLTEGKVGREDLPGQVGIGVSFQALPQIKLNSSLTMYLEKDANLEATRFGDSSLSYDIGTSAEYTVDEKFSFSLGYMYTNTDISGDNMFPEAPELDADTVTFGVCYKPNPNLTTRLSLSKVFYDNDIMADNTLLDKSIFAVGLGVEYHWD